MHEHNIEFEVHDHGLVIDDRLAALLMPEYGHLLPLERSCGMTRACQALRSYI